MPRLVPADAQTYDALVAISDRRPRALDGQVFGAAVAEDVGSEPHRDAVPLVRFDRPFGVPGKDLVPAMPRITRSAARRCPPGRPRRTRRPPRRSRPPSAEVIGRAQAVGGEDPDLDEVPEIGEPVELGQTLDTCQPEEFRCCAGRFRAVSPGGWCLPDARAVRSSAQSRAKPSRVSAATIEPLGLLSVRKLNVRLPASGEFPQRTACHLVQRAVLRTATPGTGSPARCAQQGLRMSDNCLPPISAIEATPAALVRQSSWDRLSVTTPSRRMTPAALAELERVDDEERWLWQLVDDADRAMADAPQAPALEDLNAAGRAAAAAASRQRRAGSGPRDRLALSGARVRVWLRPRQRAELWAAHEHALAALVTAAETRDAADGALREMKRQSARLRTYLAAHRRVLADADSARHDLDRRVDDLIAAYTKAPDPPAWFRFGLGYPPRAESYPQWLDRARTAVAYRRRHGVDLPMNRPHG